MLPGLVPSSGLQTLIARLEEAGMSVVKFSDVNLNPMRDTTACPQALCA